MTDEARARILAELFGQLRAAGVEHLPVGGIAMLRHVDGRDTDDVDLARAALYETDVLMLMQRQRIDIDAAVGDLAPHVTPAELRELRSIADDLRARLARMTRMEHA